jgi:cytochrome b
VSCNARGVLVWDWPVRIFHWTLVVCVAGSWATHYAGVEWFPWHQWFGYTTLVLVSFRIVWGFAGPRHARFASFLRGPVAIRDYLRNRNEVVTAGHNPIGALSVLAFLAALLFQAVSGLFANDEIANAGPFFGWVSQETSNRLAGWHAFNSNVLIALMALHVAAVAWYDLALRAGLVRAMFTGRKPLAAAGDGIDSSRAVRAIVIVLGLAVALALAIRAAPEATISFF